jgi:hypothetical protein
MHGNEGKKSDVVVLLRLEVGTRKGDRRRATMGVN